MKILDKSIQLAYDLFPEIYLQKKGYRTFHFCFGFNRSTLVGIGINQYHSSPKIQRLGKKFGNKRQKKYGAPHAEMDLISKLLGRYRIDSSLKIVSLRISPRYGLINAKPCDECQKVLDAFGVNKIWFSNEKGVIICSSDQIRENGWKL